MQDAFDYYLNVRDELNRNDKPITLMDMASIIGKYHVKVLKDENIEVSEEINACSFFTTIENNGEKERWLIQFKNETHNHPSEIEPFGGASTCIGELLDTDYQDVVTYIKLCVFQEVVMYYKNVKIL